MAGLGRRITGVHRAGGRRCPAERGIGEAISLNSDAKPNASVCVVRAPNKSSGHSQIRLSWRVRLGGAYRPRQVLSSTCRKIPHNHSIPLYGLTGGSTKQRLGTPLNSRRYGTRRAGSLDHHGIGYRRVVVLREPVPDGGDPMSLIPCDSCTQKVPEKLCQTTWAWYNADGHRVAWRQRLCTACFCSTVLPLDKDLDFANGLTCPGCGISVEHDMDPIYATFFLPGSGKSQLEIPTCAACAVNIRSRAQKGALRLEDRKVEGQGVSQGPSTPTTRESYWSGIGIRPRGDA